MGKADINRDGWTGIVGTNMRYYRMVSGLTQAEVANHVQVAPSYYSQIERGLRNTTVEVIGDIADILGVEPALLWDRGSV